MFAAEATWPSVQCTATTIGRPHALTFSNLLQDIFDIGIPVGVIIGPTTTLADIAGYIEKERISGSSRPTITSVHGPGVDKIRASDLTLDKILPAATLSDVGALAPAFTGEPHTVLMTGANGYLGRFLALDWLRRLSGTGGSLVCLVRGNDAVSALARIEDVFDGDDPVLLKEFRELAAEHLEVIVGDVGEPYFGLDEHSWHRLAQAIDLIVHPAALVNPVLPYAQLFGSNVVGIAEVIRLALTTRLKPVTNVSSVSVTMTVDPRPFRRKTVTSA